MPTQEEIDNALKILKDYQASEQAQPFATPVKSKSKKAALICPDCDHAPFKSLQALQSHQHYKHSNTPTGPNVGGVSKALSSLSAKQLEPLPDSKEEERARLLTEIAELKKQAKDNAPIETSDSKEEPLDPSLIKKLKELQGKPSKHLLENGILEGNDAKAEIAAMGPSASWLKSVKSNKIKFGSKIPKHFTFKTGNYAAIYRGDTFMRFAPFVAKNDLESDQWWMQFAIDDFFGKPKSWMPWDLPTTKIVWMGLDLSSDYCDNLGSGGRYVKVDESAKCQMPLYIRLSDEEKKKILKNNRMVAQALLLKSTLQKYEKPKANWLFYAVIGIVIIAVAAILMLYLINPHIFSGISNALSGITKTLLPPGAPSTVTTTAHYTTIPATTIPANST